MLKEVVKKFFFLDDVVLQRTHTLGRLGEIRVVPDLLSGRIDMRIAVAGAACTVPTAAKAAVQNRALSAVLTVVVCIMFLLEVFDSSLVVYVPKIGRTNALTGRTPTAKIT